MYFYQSIALTAVLEHKKKKQTTKKQIILWQVFQFGWTLLDTY